MVVHIESNMEFLQKYRLQRFPREQKEGKPVKLSHFNLSRKRQSIVHGPLALESSDHSYN